MNSKQKTIQSLVGIIEIAIGIAIEIEGKL